MSRCDKIKYVYLTETGVKFKYHPTVNLTLMLHLGISTQSLAEIFDQHDSHLVESFRITTHILGDIDCS